MRFVKTTRHQGTIQEIKYYYTFDPRSPSRRMLVARRPKSTGLRRPKPSPIGSTSAQVGRYRAIFLGDGPIAVRGDYRAAAPSQRGGVGPFSFAGWGELYAISCIIANLGNCFCSFS
ncbi:hypothetical protein BQ8794_100032 [Mesorhizobium prunaredense]|uniref:Uncharacterized protein n=1 Tax=Mesorhizobium prunaredense TaxID=1631249 RepID=A0A1R3UZR7_9HYPH|nr:hypothetical protein BQ8794_100032 [Mesorhizobium prunaredense]